MKAVRTYKSRYALYDERGGRWADERDYGMRNVNDLEGFRPGAEGGIRVSVNSDTGDVYAQAGSGLDLPSALIGRVAPGGRDTIAEADRIFAGWDAAPGPGRQLSWFMGKLAAARA